MAIIQSGASADLLTVGATSKAARTTPYAEDGTPVVRVRGSAVSANDSFIVTGGMNDDNYRMQRMDRMGNAGLALNNLLLTEPFEGTTLPIPNRFNTLANTAILPAQTAAGGLNFNSTNLTTSGGAAVIVSARQFPKLQKTPLHAKFRARALHVTNAVIEFGFGSPANQTSSPTIGAYFQITTAGVVQGVLTFNGVDQTISFTMPGSWQNNYYTWDIVMDDDEVIFFIQDTSTGLIVGERKVQIALTAVRHWNASRLPVFARFHNVTAPATAANLILTSLDVVALDTQFNRPWGHAAALMGMGGEVSPTAFTQTANYTNSVAPANATLSNTAAGYGTLGGHFQFLPLASNEADYALFGFTVPAPYSFVCTGIDIDTINLGAAVATTATVLIWFASGDQTAISLATATNRRVPLGIQSFAIGAAIGAVAQTINRTFTDAPIVTHGGRLMVVGVKLPVSTATASQVIRGTCAVHGYFE